MKEDLLTYLETEKAYILDDIAAQKALSIPEQVERGIRIDPLKLVWQTGDEALFEAEENNSRLRTGERVILLFDKKRLPAIILENFLSEVSLRLEEPATLSQTDSYAVLAQSVQMLDPIIEGLKRLHAGGPGWSFWQALTGLPVLSPRFLPGRLTLEQARQKASALAYETSSHQKEIIAKALQQPPLMAIQGPPGTGKSYLLAIIATELFALRKRVVILAPTHQAVNNCLLAVHHLQTGIPLVKIGDSIHAARLPNTIQKLTFREYNKKLKTDRRIESGILAMTYYSAILHLGLRSNAFAPNVILIDEAGQIPFSYSGAAGLFGAGSHILFGDDAQLPPVFDSRLKDHPLSLSLFQQVRRSNPDDITALTETHRLNEEVCQFISERYYRNPDTNEPFLYPSIEAAGRHLDLDFPLGIPDWISELLSPSPSIVFCGDRFSDPGQQQINLKEAKTAAEVVRWALKLGLKKEQIAVVSPFRRQSLQIRSLLLNEVGLQSDELPVIDTVERVQGASVDLTIFSLAATDPAFIATIQTFLYSPNRLNVALSRAKRKVIVLGNLY